jgi:hypothetical protein
MKIFAISTMMRFLSLPKLLLKDFDSLANEKMFTFPFQQPIQSDQRQKSSAALPVSLKIHQNFIFQMLKINIQTLRFLKKHLTGKARVIRNLFFSSEFLFFWQKKYKLIRKLCLVSLSLSSLANIRLHSLTDVSFLS